MGVSQNYGYHFGVPAVRSVVFWGLYWDPPIGELPYNEDSSPMYGNTHVSKSRGFRRALHQAEAPQPPLPG